MNEFKHITSGEAGQVAAAVNAIGQRARDERMLQKCIKVMVYVERAAPAGTPMFVKRDLVEAFLPLADFLPEVA